MSRTYPNTKCKMCDKIKSCLEYLDGFICESCFDCHFECSQCGEIHQDDGFDIIHLNSGVTRCPSCLEDDSFRQLEVF